MGENAALHVSGFGGEDVPPGGAARAKWMRCAAPPALRLVGALLQFCATVLIARVLGDGRSGEFFFWSAVLMSFGQVATFGMDKVALQQVPRLDGDTRALASFLAAVRGMALILALAIGIVLAGYALVAQSDAGRPGAWYLLLPAGVAGVALCRINGEAMKGMGRPILAVLYRHLGATSIYLFMLLVVGTQLNPELALICFAAGFCVAGFVAPIAPGFAGLSPRVRLPNREDFRTKLLLGLPICTGAVLTAFNFIIPLSILERWHHSADVAYLTTSYRLFMLFEVLALAVYAIAMPKLSRLAHATDWREASRTYRESIFQGLVLLAPPVVVAIAAAEPLMSLFGESFVKAAPVLRTLLAFRLVTLCLGPAEDLTLMTGRTGKLATFALAKLLLTLALAPFVVPAYGALGMAVVIGLGALLQKVLCLLDFAKHSKGIGKERGGG